MLPVANVLTRMSMSTHGNMLRKICMLNEEHPHMAIFLEIIYNLAVAKPGLKWIPKLNAKKCIYLFWFRIPRIPQLGGKHAIIIYLFHDQCSHLNYSCHFQPTLAERS